MRLTATQGAAFGRKPVSHYAVCISRFLPGQQGMQVRKMIRRYPIGSVEMEDYFDKRMALDVIEDALTVLGAPENRGFAIGLSGGFYLCGLLTQAEWEAVLDRIQERRGRV